MSRLFMTKRRSTTRFLPEARVTGAEPAWGLRAACSRDRRSGSGAEGRVGGTGRGAGRGHRAVRRR